MGDMFTALKTQPAVNFGPWILSLNGSTTNTLAYNALPPSGLERVKGIEPSS